MGAATGACCHTDLLKEHGALEAKRRPPEASSSGSSRRSSRLAALSCCRCDDHWPDPIAKVLVVPQRPMDAQGDLVCYGNGRWEEHAAAKPAAATTDRSDLPPFSPRFLRGSDSILTPYKWQPLINNSSEEEMIPTMSVAPGAPADKAALGGRTLLPRALSHGSEIALQHLAQLSDRLARLESRTRQVHEAVQAGGNMGSTPRRMSHKRALADIQGIVTALKLLSEPGVDAVEEADLHSGKEAAQTSKRLHKQREEELTRRLEFLRDDFIANSHSI
mmetsp:Transcript_31093/g.82392  ORF Transcript_31093/g.82392 Transcript_31093/m.82392 type:complete len:276 (+) Transcript_31093:17-844(+)